MSPYFKTAFLKEYSSHISAAWTIPVSKILVFCLNSRQLCEISEQPCHVQIPSDESFLSITASQIWEPSSPAHISSIDTFELPWFPRPLAGRKARSPPALPSRLLGRVSPLFSLPSTLFSPLPPLSSEFPALSQSYSPELPSGCKREKSGENRSSPSGSPLYCTYRRIILLVAFREPSQPPLCIQSHAPPSLC